MMKRRSLIIAGAAAAIALAPGITALPVQAQSVQSGAVQSGAGGNAAVVAEVESFLQTVRSLRADFIQRTDQGGYAEGRFYLDRPGRMRIEYEQIPNLIIANGSWLTFYDLELGQRSDQWLSSSLAGFIARERISLSGDITVTDVSTEFNVIRVNLVQTDDPSSGELSLVFDRDPMKLKGWLVRDPQGITTEIILENVETGISLSGNLFQTPQQFRR